MTNLLGPICNLLFKKNLLMLWDWARTQDQGLYTRYHISPSCLDSMCILQHAPGPVLSSTRQYMLCTTQFLFSFFNLFKFFFSKLDAY